MNKIIFLLVGNRRYSDVLRCTLLSVAALVRAFGLPIFCEIKITAFY